MKIIKIGFIIVGILIFISFMSTFFITINDAKTWQMILAICLIADFASVMILREVEKNEKRKKNRI